MWFVIGIIVIVTLGLMFWYLRDYSRTGALHPEVGNKIPMEREMFIPLLRNALHKALVKMAGQENKEKLDALSDELDLKIKMEYRSLLSEMIKDFEVFDPTYAKMQHDVFTDAERTKAEQRFLNNFMIMMEKANFKILSKAELEFAESEQYLLHIPVSTEWDKIDAKMLPNFFATEEGKKHAQENAADMTKQVIIWRRGIGIDRTTGLLLTEKIDVVLTRWFDSLANKIVRSNFWTQLTGDKITAPRHAQMRPLGPNEETVDRISLKDMPLSWNFLSKPTTIQEPTFKEVVAMFRFVKKTEDDSEPDTSIHIKTFRDIPLGDMDIIFPAKKILFKTYDFIRLGVTGILGLFFALYTFSELASGADVDASLMTACIGFLAYASRTYWAIQWSVDTYRTILSETLYNKSADSHRGVILFLMEALEAQELKEAMIAYTLLLKNNRPMTEKELDQQAEEFLKQEINAAAPKAKPGDAPIKMPTVDFEVDDAIDKLKKYGKATVKGERGERIVELI